MRAFWYASTLRPPSSFTMPKGSLPLVQRKFLGSVFHAWAYPERLPLELCERFFIKLVAVSVEKD